LWGSRPPKKGPETALGFELELVVLGGQLTGGQLEPLAILDKSAREDAEGVLRQQPDASL